MKIYIWGEKARYRTYQWAVEQAGGHICFDECPDICDALLLPGGGDLAPWRYGQENTASRNLEPARDTAELELLEQFVFQKKPVLGICRGAQVINVFFGGTLIQDLPGHDQTGGADRLHRVYSLHTSIITACGEEAVVNSAHHQAVDRLGAGLHAVQWASDGVVEALCHRYLPVWGVQWHPERLGGTLGIQFLRAFFSLIT